jgi:hypothetical protein
MLSTPVDELTLDQVVQAMPANLKNSVSQSLVDTINNIAADPILTESIRTNFISYTGVLKDGKFKAEDYLNAVMYVSYKLMGHTNQDSYAKTFPRRYATLVAKGTPTKDIAAYVVAYNKGKLVNLILEQTLVPTYVLNASIYQEAINTQAWLMNNANSEKVRTEAANSILTHLKRPEAVKGSIDINVQDVSGVNELKNALRDLAIGQLKSIDEGSSVALIAASPIIEVEGKDVGID